MDVDCLELTLISSHLASDKRDEVILRDSAKRRKSLDNTLRPNDFANEVNVLKLILVFQVLLQQLVENTVESLLGVSVNESVFEGPLGLVNHNFD